MEAQQKEDVESKLQPGDQRWGKEDAKRGGRLYMAKEVPNSGVSAQCLCGLFSFQLQCVAEAVRGGSHEAQGAAQQEEGPEENRTLQTLRPGSEAVCVL